MSANLKTVTRLRLINGIDAEEIPVQIFSKLTKFIHGEFNTKFITPEKDGEPIGLPDYMVMGILKEWNKLPDYPGDLEIIMRSEYDPVRDYYGMKKYTTNIVEQDFIPKYECDSRQVFKAVNTLNKRIVTQRKVCDRSPNYQAEGTRYLPINTALKACLMTDPLEQVRFLDDYATIHISHMLKKDPLFRHIYKIIHPDTKFIRVPMN